MIPCFAAVILCIICCIKFYFFAAVIIFAGVYNYYPWRIALFAGDNSIYCWRIAIFARDKALPPTLGSLASWNSPGISVFGAPAVGFSLLVLCSSLGHMEDQK
jgi:hypothetical protein